LDSVPRNPLAVDCSYDVVAGACGVLGRLWWSDLEQWGVTGSTWWN
jgi:hypothetical protein